MATYAPTRPRTELFPLDYVNYSNLGHPGNICKPWRLSGAITCNRMDLCKFRNHLETSPRSFPWHMHVCANICNWCKMCKILKTSMCKYKQTLTKSWKLLKSYLLPSTRLMHVSADICKLMQTYATYVNLCNILKSSKIIFTAFPETYALVRRHMPPMQTYAKSWKRIQSCLLPSPRLMHVYADICNLCKHMQLMQTP